MHRRQTPEDFNTIYIIDELIINSNYTEVTEVVNFFLKNLGKPLYLVEYSGFLINLSGVETVETLQRQHGQQAGDQAQSHAQKGAHHRYQQGSHRVAEGVDH